MTRTASLQVAPIDFDLPPNGGSRRRRPPGDVGGADTTLIPTPLSCGASRETRPATIRGILLL